MNSRNNNATLQYDFNAVAGKIVDSNELEAREKALFAQNFSFKEKAFRLLIDTPHSFLAAKIEEVKFFSKVVSHAFRKRMSFERSQEFIADQEPGNVYQDPKTNDLYIDCDFFKHTVQPSGLNMAFQKKSALLSIQAFEECRDHSALVSKGQIKPL